MALPTGQDGPRQIDDYGLVAYGAEILKLSQFDVFRLAYRRWYGREADFRALERVFGRYLTHGVAPHWVRHLARDLSGDGADRDRFAADDLPRREGLPSAPPSPYPVLVFFSALAIYAIMLV